MAVTKKKKDGNLKGEEEKGEEETYPGKKRDVPPTYGGKPYNSGTYNLAAVVVTKTSSALSADAGRGGEDGQVSFCLVTVEVLSSRT